MAGGELIITPAQQENLVALAAFMRANESATADPGRLKHWYFGNPSGSASVIMGTIQERIAGMATTNDHYFERQGERVLVAMPQKVLTDGTLRGQGIFGRLYRSAEAACMERGAAFFLTVTNKASTPIFLNKFGYQRLPSPRLVILPPAFGGGSGAGVPDLDPSGRTALHSPGDIWHMVKDHHHLEWRYSRSSGTYIHLVVTQEHVSLGELYLKKISRKGIPLMLLMDVVPAPGRSTADLLKAARRMTLKHGCIALLLLEQDVLRPAIAHMPCLRRSSGFNLLIKGRDVAHTRQLSEQRFEITFGDLDFF